MRHIFLFLCLSVICKLAVLAQISGGFYYQNGYVYFVGQNVSGRVLSNLTVKCVNSVLNQQQSYSLSFLANGDSFSVGPENGWQWQAGEQLFVVYGNGQSAYWIFQPAPSYNIPYNNSSSTESFSDNMVIQEKFASWNGEYGMQKGVCVSMKNGIGKILLFRVAN